MGFLSKIISATVKTVLTPVAIVKDVANVVTGQDVDSTKNLINSAIEDASDSVDDFCDGQL